MRWPGHLPAGTAVNEVVRLTEVVPTMLELAGIPAPAGLEGRTLLPLVDGQETAPRVAFAENLLFAEGRGALRMPDRKYVRWENGSTVT